VRCRGLPITEKSGVSQSRDSAPTSATTRGTTTSATFDETSTRQRFVDPLFPALGWDVADEQKQGPLAEVVLEVSLRARRQYDATAGLEDEEREGRRVADAVNAKQDPGIVGAGIRFRLLARLVALARAPQASADAVAWPLPCAAPEKSLSRAAFIAVMNCPATNDGRRSSP
jgi:hypothetical protein